MRGILLAGGRGTRLQPVTRATSKQLLPVYDKPVIYYSLSVLMQIGIREILIVCAPDAMSAFRALLGDGRHLGIELSYAAQARPRGIAEALVIGEPHIAGGDCALMLGDNIFHGPGLGERLRKAAADLDGCVLFGKEVAEPRSFGVAELGEEGELISIEEKPENPRSKQAVTGLYFYDDRASRIAAELSPSPRGELEITDVNRFYVEERSARLVPLDDDFLWYDTGTEESLFDAGAHVRRLTHEHGFRVGCVEQVALEMGFIDAEECFRLGREMGDSPYGRYVVDVARSLDREYREGEVL